MSHYYLFLFIALLFSTSVKSQSSQPITNFGEIKTLIDSNRLETEYTIATTHHSYFLEPGTPYSDQNIRIGQDSAFIIVKDSIAAGYLPYFGSGYSIPQTGSKGITFSGKMINQSSSIKGRGKRQSATYEFSVVGANDSYKITMVIQNNGVCYLYINSTKRSPISYIGQVVEKVY